MMMKIKRWLMERYFPAEAKLHIAALQSELDKKEAEIDRLNAYIDGLENGIRYQRRVTIHNEVAK